MKILLIILSVFTFTQGAMASWVDNLILEIEARGVEIKNEGDLIRYLQSTNLESKELFKTEASTESTNSEISSLENTHSESMKSAHGLMQILESHDGKKIQINYFKNAYFYGDRRKIDRRLATIPGSTGVKSVVKKNIKRRDAFQFESQFYFSRIDAKDSQNGGHFQLSSKMNMGLDAFYKRRLNRRMNLLFNLGGHFIAFNPPSTINLAGESGLYLQGASTLLWQLDSIFLTKASIGMKQLPYLTAFGSQYEVDQVLQPFFGAGLELKLKKLIKVDLRPEVQAIVLNNSIKSDVNADSGFQMGALIHYYFNYKEYNPRLSLWYNSYSQKTNNTDQSMTEVGLNLGFELPL